LKVLQGSILLKEIENIQLMKENPIPIIIAGDFNSFPSSTIYKIYDQGTLLEGNNIPDYTSKMMHELMSKYPSVS